MRIKIQPSLLLLLFLLVAGCDSETTDPDFERLGYQYFPVSVGDFRVYDVREINFSLLEGGDTNQYQLKEVIEAIQHQNDDDTSYFLHRYSRLSDDAAWQLDSLWTVRKDPRRIVVVENNVPVIKLVFPVQEGLSWDANGMNAEEAEDFTIEALGQPYELAGETFEETLKVIEKNNMDTVITERYREVVYAAGIGMIRKEERFIDYCATNVECLGLGIIEGGRKLEYSLTAYGKE